MNARNHYVYMVRCVDGSLYTGYTVDVPRRVDEHNRGTGAKYTRSRRPVVLAYVECHETKGEALRREYQIRTLHKAEKEALARTDGGETTDCRSLP